MRLRMMLAIAFMAAVGAILVAIALDELPDDED